MKRLDLSRLVNNGLIDIDVLRESLEQLEQNIFDNPVRKFDGKFFEIVFTGSVSNELYKHNLGFEPKDVIILSTNPSTITVSFVYENSGWDNNNVVITTNGAVTIRALIGRYREDEE